MRIKRYVAMVLCAALALSATGCGSAADNKETTAAEALPANGEEEAPASANAENTQAQQQVTTESTLEKSEEETTSTEKGKFEYEIPEVSIEKKELPDEEDIQFVQDLKLGWNLGNTFDAADVRSITAENELDYESTWNGVVTTPEMLDTIKAAGFDTIRIPVSWHNHMTEDDYVISEVWMDRVAEVVDWAIDDGFYVIINIHHDNTIEENSNCFFYPSSEYYEQSEKYVTAVWTQVAERFKDYDEHLIFESLNEPRLVGTSLEWMINNSEMSLDAMDCINKLNQVFVDVVRATGGNNATRYITVPGYAASWDAAVNDNFKVPEDTVENRLLVTVHAYIPYFFALADESTKGSVSDFDINSSDSTGEIDRMCEALYDKFVSKGCPVIIDEMGAVSKTDNFQDRINWATYYVAKARANGITCLWWDNNSFDNGQLGLFNRKLNKIPFKLLVEAMLKYCE
jgi:endoglucanase